MDLIQMRRGTSSAWNAANPVLAEGEPGRELDTGRTKIGDGSTPWVGLPYENTPVAPGAIGNGFAGAVLTKSATQTLTAGAEIAVTFNGELRDTHDFHDNAAPTRLVAPVAGTYLVGGSVEVLSLPNGASAIVRLRKNGVNLTGDGRARSNLSGGSNSFPSGFISRPVDMLPGDYIEITIEVSAVNSGTTAARSTLDGTSFWIMATNTDHTHDDRYYTETETDTLLADKADAADLAEKADAVHDHDDRYYTETEVDTALAGKSGTGHTHDDRYYTETETDTLLADKADAADLAEKADAVHDHDDRYYTETEVDTALAGKSGTGHTHDDRYYTEAEADARFRLNSTPIVLPAGVFGSISGSPSLGTAPANRRIGWLLDANVMERVAADTALPADWANVRVSILWANAGTNGGAVKWRVALHSPQTGDDVNVFISADLNPAAVTPGGHWILQKTVLGTTTGFTAGSTSLFVYIDRHADDPTDTLTNDAAFYALIIEEV